MLCSLFSPFLFVFSTGTFFELPVIILPRLDRNSIPFPDGLGGGGVRSYLEYSSLREDEFVSVSERFPVEVWTSEGLAPISAVGVVERLVSRGLAPIFAADSGIDNKRRRVKGSWGVERFGLGDLLWSG